MRNIPEQRRSQVYTYFIFENLTNIQYKFTSYCSLHFIIKKVVFCPFHERFLSYWNQDWDGQGT
jgi:hypothetical protein